MRYHFDGLIDEIKSGGGYRGIRYKYISQIPQPDGNSDGDSEDLSNHWIIADLLNDRHSEDRRNETDDSKDQLNDAGPLENQGDGSGLPGDQIDVDHQGNEGDDNMIQNTDCHIWVRLSEIRARCFAPISDRRAIRK